MARDTTGAAKARGLLSGTTCRCPSTAVIACASSVDVISLFDDAYGTTCVNDVWLRYARTSPSKETPPTKVKTPPAHEAVKRREEEVPATRRTWPRPQRRMIAASGARPSDHRRRDALPVAAVYAPPLIRRLPGRPTRQPAYPQDDASPGPTRSGGRVVVCAVSRSPGDGAPLRLPPPGTGTDPRDRRRPQPARAPPGPGRRRSERRAVHEAPGPAEADAVTRPAREQPG
ncbi:hypothetical protein GCM10023238_00810 [Streptomyces heliomycini]